MAELHNRTITDAPHSGQAARHPPSAFHSTREAAVASLRRMSISYGPEEVLVSNENRLQDARPQSVSKSVAA